jgi:lysylphosphatidylglycerol synthetase-like protein (DUF2156 family)
MTNPTTLIPAKVRLVIYLLVFLFSVALTAIGQYYTTLEQPIPDLIRGLGGAIAPIAAVFSAVAASNTTDNSDQRPAVTNVYHGEGGRISLLAALAFALLAAAVVSLILGAHPVLVFILFIIAIVIGWFSWFQRVHADATHQDIGRPSTILDRDWH